MNPLILTTGDLSIPNTTTQTLYVLEVPANTYCKVRSIGIFCSAGVATDANIKIELKRSSNNFASGGTTLAPVTKRKDNAATIRTTGKKYAGGATEPTMVTTLATLYLHPQVGVQRFFNEGEEIWIGGGSADYLAIVCTTSQSYGSNYITVELDLEE